RRRSIFETANSISPWAGSSKGTPSWTTVMRASSTPPAMRVAFTWPEMAMYRVAREYFQRERMGKATRRETMSGAPRAMAGVGGVVAAGEDGGAGESEGLDVELAVAGVGEERRGIASEQGGFDTGRGEAFEEPEDLPLAAAHLAAGVEVEDSHQLMILALEYF